MSRNKKIIGIVLGVVIVIGLCLVVLIPAILGVTTSGISNTQSVLRDNQRRGTVQEIMFGLNEYLANYGEYPSAITWSAEAAVIAANNVVPLEAVAKYNDVGTDASGTDYYYRLVGDEYMLCAMLESGEVYNLGTASALCTDEVRRSGETDK